jgi:hypothetical protein
MVTAVSGAPGSESAQPTIRETIVLVRWVFIIACAYIMLFSEGQENYLGLAPAVIALFLASNLLVGRLSPETVATQGFRVGVGLLDTVLISATLVLAGQLSVEILLLFLAIMVMTIAGLELAVIARLTIVLSLGDVLLVWLTGSDSVWRSSMLLRVPFLLTAALLYGSLAEAKGLQIAGRNPAG